MRKGLPIALLFAFVAMMAACAPAADKDAANAAAVSVEWSPEVDCATCHATETASRENANCLASLHAASNCVDCHTETDVLASEHEGVTTEDRVAKRLTKTSVSQEYCLTCHGSYEALAEKTTYRLVDTEGTAVNPHAIPVNDNHADVTCTSCHSMHSEKSAEDGATALCLGCHHAEVFACGTCH